MKTLKKTIVQGEKRGVGAWGIGGQGMVQLHHQMTLYLSVSAVAATAACSLWKQIYTAHLPHGGLHGLLLPSRKCSFNGKPITERPFV